MTLHLTHKWKFAAIGQFISIFGEALNINDLDVQVRASTTKKLADECRNWKAS
jgi:hypothetical protein